MGYVLPRLRTLCAGVASLIAGIVLAVTSCRAPMGEQPSSAVGVLHEHPPSNPIVRDRDAGALAPTPEPLPTLQPSEHAIAWLDAVRRRDVSVLATHTQFPFELRDEGTAGTPGRCGVLQRAKDVRSGRAAIDCLLQDEVVIRVLQAASAIEVQQLQPVHLRAWPTSWRTKIAPGLTPFGAFFRTDAAAFEFVVQASAAGVSTVWKRGYDATAQVRLAAEWVKALGQRDLESLERLTSYPFELRDTEVEAHCGSQRAAIPKEMPAVAACLMDDPVFNDAMKNGVRIRAAMTQDFEPGVFEGWRRPEHVELWPAMALIANRAGNEYDLAFLVAKDGVRVFWKRGSFISGD